MFVKVNLQHGHSSYSMGILGKLFVMFEPFKETSIHAFKLLGVLKIFFGVPVVPLELIVHPFSKISFKSIIVQTLAKLLLILIVNSYKYHIIIQLNE